MSLIFLSLKCERTGQIRLFDSAIKYGIRAPSISVPSAEMGGKLSHNSWAGSIRRIHLDPYIVSKPGLGSRPQFHPVQRPFQFRRARGHSNVGAESRASQVPASRGSHRLPAVAGPLHLKPPAIHNAQGFSGPNALHRSPKAVNLKVLPASFSTLRIAV